MPLQFSFSSFLFHHQPSHPAFCCYVKFVIFKWNWTLICKLNIPQFKRIPQLPQYKMILHVPYFPAHKTHLFPQKSDLNLIRVLCAEGKYYSQT
jgi:hypothetical protein